LSQASRLRELGEWRLADGGCIPLLRVRDRRARRLRLSVGERGLRLSIPWRLAERAAEAFLHAQAAWIEAQWQRYAAAGTALSWRHGAIDALPLWGRDWPVQWRSGRAIRIELDADHGLLCFHAPESAGEAGLRRALREAYAAEARARIGRLLPPLLDGLPRPPRELRLRPLSSLWGSLSADGRVSLDLALVLGPAEAFDYVLVHELCHLLRADHSPAFWAEVEARFPAWREQRRYLRSDAGLALKARWRHLLGR
jgi:hypothetical protein